MKPTDGNPHDRETARGGGAAASAIDPLVGRIVADRFEVLRPIATGGSGRVYRARQLGLDREVALKLLHPHLAHDEEQTARFHREARAASRIRHPSAVVIHDFGRWEDRLFIAMELIVGQPLDLLLDAEFPLAPERIVALLAPVCEVLQTAHDAGLLHRDVKSPNIMVVRGKDGGETVKLVDFGLVTSITAESEFGRALTPTGLVSGTPAYMSPEQCRGAALDGRSDLYALGVVLFELLCQEVPFTACSQTDIIIQHMFSEPPRPSEIARNVAIDPLLERLALQALSKNPANRPQTALAFRDALLAVVGRAPRPILPERDPEERQLSQQDRAARARAAGIPETPAETRKLAAPGTAPELTAVVVEPPTAFADSLTAVLRAQGFEVTPVADLSAAVGVVPRAGRAVLVVDIRGAALPLLDRLAALRAEGRIAAPVVVVGPEDSLAPMTRALELGVSDYVPESVVVARLPRAVQRARRSV